MPSERVEQGEAMALLVRTGWAQDNEAFRQMFATVFMPDAPPENHQWFNELQRITTSPDNAADLMLALGDVDVSHRLAQVQIPTLVIHSRGDLSAPFEQGKELAAGIPGARFVSLDSQNHLLPECDPAWPTMLQEIDAFLAEEA